MKVVWVTGASSGLGYYTACALEQAGYTVVAVDKSVDNFMVGHRRVVLVLQYSHYRRVVQILNGVFHRADGEAGVSARFGEANFRSLKDESAGMAPVSG